MPFHNSTKPRHLALTRLTDDERVWVDDRLLETGVSTSSYLRNLVVRDRAEHEDATAKLELVLELLMTMHLSIRRYFERGDKDLETIARQAESEADVELAALRERIRKRKGWKTELMKGRGV